MFVVYPRLTPAANTTDCGIEKSGTSWIDYQTWLKSLSTHDKKKIDPFQRALQKGGKKRQHVETRVNKGAHL